MSSYECLRRPFLIIHDVGLFCAYTSESSHQSISNEGFICSSIRIVAFVLVVYLHG